jgi:starvation-inducible DNA-binding protein
MINEVIDMLHRAPLTTPSTFSEKAVQDISRTLILLLSDVFALYLKTKNFHWHMSGSHFRDYHLMLDDQGEQIFSMTDVIAERARKLGGTTVRSIGQISRAQRIADNDAEYVKPLDMLAELRDDNAILTRNMREVHSLCDEAGDVAAHLRRCAGCGPLFWPRRSRRSHARTGAWCGIRRDWKRNERATLGRDPAKRRLGEPTRRPKADFGP